MRFLITLLLLSCYASLFAQNQAPENWFNLDPSADGVYGVSSEKAYKTFLEGKKSVPVVVAIIDSGVDNKHEDLDDVMWVNPNEIPGNGIDDDGNGYIDDINGWNFIGGKSGNVDHDTYEATRIYKNLKYKYESADPDKLTKKQRVEYNLFVKVRDEVESKLEKANKNYKLYKDQKDRMIEAVDEVANALGNDISDQNKLDSVGNLSDQKYKMGVSIIKNIGIENASIAKVKEKINQEVDGALDYFKNQIDYAYNVDFNPRTIVGDNYSDSEEKHYGNNDVQGPDALHGTHVAGIVAAERTNDIGMKGVANNVKIMSVRAVPNGDERDKDIANSIRYAVDNGANIINMSFGKGYSENEKLVEKAIKYAEKNDVLMVHAAGNSSLDIDVKDNFPNDIYEKKFLFFWKKKKRFKNWVTVGALNWEDGKSSIATFSNYGKKNVDIFAPGVAIYSTTPDNNYKSLRGTSMASPVVAGVAALVRSYYPSLTAEQVKEILIESSIKRDIDVIKPGSDDTTKFQELCVSGGIVNAERALLLASKTKGKKKIKRPKA